MTTATGQQITWVFTGDDPIANLQQLARERHRLLTEIEAAMTELLVEARLERRFDAAVGASGLSRTTCLKLTREYNERGGRSIRWADGLDPTSTAHAASE